LHDIQLLRFNYLLFTQTIVATIYQSVIPTITISIKPTSQKYIYALQHTQPIAETVA